MIILILPQNCLFTEQDFHFLVFSPWFVQTFSQLYPAQSLMSTAQHLPPITHGKGVGSLREEGKWEGMWVFRILALQCPQRECLTTAYSFAICSLEPLSATCRSCTILHAGTSVASQASFLNYGSFRSHTRVGHPVRTLHCCWVAHYLQRFKCTYWVLAFY